MRNRNIGTHPAIGIRPIIDARRGTLGVRESLEEQTMNMAKSAKKLFEENLRYSKGTRRAKGRNLAIAEWPTDSTVGNNGRVDYALFIDTKLAATVEASSRSVTFFASLSWVRYSPNDNSLSATNLSSFSFCLL